MPAWAFSNAWKASACSAGGTLLERSIRNTTDRLSLRRTQCIPASASTISTITVERATSATPRRTPPRPANERNDSSTMNGMSPSSTR